MYPHDYIVINGVKTKPPRYFDRLLKRVSPDVLLEIKAQREYDGYQRRDDATDDRLAVRETVTRAAISHLKRN